MRLFEGDKRKRVDLVAAEAGSVVTQGRVGFDG